MNRYACIMLVMAESLLCSPARSDTSIGSIAQRASIAGGTSIQHLNVGIDPQQERSTKPLSEERDVREMRPAKIGRF